MKLPVGFIQDRRAALVVGEVATRRHRHPDRAIYRFVDRIDILAEQVGGHKIKRCVFSTGLLGRQNRITPERLVNDFSATGAL